MMKFVYNISDYEFVSVRLNKIIDFIHFFLQLCKSINSSQMICLSPGIDKNLSLNPPIDLDVRFVMDNAIIIPKNNILTILNDPIYHPFEDYIQQINSTNIIQFRV